MKKYNQANQIETPHEYRYVGVNSMHKGTLSHQAKAMHCMYESLDGHLRGGMIVGVPCWEHKSHLIRAW